MSTETSARSTVSLSGRSHTPAPWRLNWKISGGGPHPNFPQLHYVSVEGTRTDSNCDLHLTGYIHKPDAYLICAAPDLLALARKFASECAECGGTGVVSRQIGGDGYGDRCAAIADVEIECAECEDIRKVIAKAEGRS